jgi:PEGA domain
MRWLALCLAFLLVSLGPDRRARGDDEDPVVTQARKAFLEGVELTHQSQWGDALTAFERSARLRPHAVTSFNLGACERALGRYVRARQWFRLTLDQYEKSAKRELSDQLAAEASAMLGELDRIVATFDVTVSPANAAIAVDGRPLEAGGVDAQGPLFLAGTRDPGAGEPIAVGKFRLAVDPGVHVVTFSRLGFSDAVINRTVGPGGVLPLRIELDRLPSTLRVESDRLGAIVSLNGVDVGPTPVELQRPAGLYHVLVQHKGYADYNTSVSTRPGERVDLLAKLPEVHRSLTEQWWFWAATGVVLVGVGVGTYFVTRSNPPAERPPVDTGGTGWMVKLP